MWWPHKLPHRDDDAAAPMAAQPGPPPGTGTTERQPAPARNAPRANQGNTEGERRSNKRKVPDAPAPGGEEGDDETRHPIANMAETLKRMALAQHSLEGASQTGHYFRAWKALKWRRHKASYNAMHGGSHT